MTQSYQSQNQTNNEMDPLISSYKSINFDEHGDLSFCPDEQLAYQTDMSVSVLYDKDYFEKYVGYEDTEISNGINQVRKHLTEKYANCVLDVGIGSGEFIVKSSLRCYGYDINPYGVEWLKKRNSFLDPYQAIPDCIDGISLWDTMEHIKNPHKLLSATRIGTYAFISMPIFDDIKNIKQSKHYRPNEHYYYFSKKGLATYMFELGYDLIEVSKGETEAGREDILSFVFLRTTPNKRDRQLMFPLPIRETSMPKKRMIGIKSAGVIPQFA